MMRLGLAARWKSCMALIETVHVNLIRKESHLGAKIGAQIVGAEFLIQRKILRLP